MKELLEIQEKLLVKENFKDHILYKLINLSCKKYEVEMSHLKFSPEEIFLGVLLLLETIRDADDASSIIRTFWFELVCKYRERGENVSDSEVNLAVCSVLCILYICLSTQDDAESIALTGNIAMELAKHYGNEVHARLDGIMSEIWQTENGEEELKEWVSTYLDGTDCLSEKIESIISCKDDAPIQNNTEDDFPLDSTQCVILYSFLLGDGISCLDTNDSKMAEFISKVTPYRSNSIRTIIGRIKKKNKYGKKTVQDALKVAEIVKILKPEIAKDIEDTFAP